MTDVNAGPSRFSYSTDRGHHWKGPFRLPLFGQAGIAGRTDYLVNGPARLHAVPDGLEGRSPGGPAALRPDHRRRQDLAVRRRWIGPEPTGFAIMPATVRLSEPRVADGHPPARGNQALDRDLPVADDGQSWTLDTAPAPDLGEGNPASLIRLADGRICLTYGHRAAPFSIRARLSRDGGHHLGSRDRPPRRRRRTRPGISAERPAPGRKIVTVYYFWDRETGPERYIAATIWDPGSRELEPPARWPGRGIMLSGGSGDGTPSSLRSRESSRESSS